MPVFDFNDEPKEEKKAPECTYTVIRSNETEASPEHPILVLDNSSRKWEHHSWGVFTNPVRKTAFEFQTEGGGTVSADILKVDARFVSLLKWLGESHINVRLPVLMKQMGMLYTRSVRSLLAVVPSFPQRTAFYST